MFVNGEPEKVDHDLGNFKSFNWQYNFPLNIHSKESAVCLRTSGNMTSVSVYNLSPTYDLTFHIQGRGLDQVYTIKANDREPFRIVHHFHRAQLLITNISKESATLNATLNDLGD